MPGFTGFKSDLEAEPAIGIHCFSLAVPRRDRDSADEIAVTINRPKLLLRLRPFRGDPTAADDAARLHLENVCKIAAQRDLELKLHPLHAVVRDVEILVHTAVDRSAHDEPEGARWDDAIRGRNPPIGEISP